MVQNSKVMDTSMALKKLQLLNRYYRITQFYSFLKKVAIKGGIVLLVFASVLLFLEYFFLDFDYLLNTLVASHSATVVISFFLLSETVLGLVPPELFIAWASKSATPLRHLQHSHLFSDLCGWIRMSTLRQRKWAM